MAQEVFSAKEGAISSLNAINRSARRQDVQTEHTPLSYDDMDIIEKGMPILKERGYDSVNTLLAYQDALTSWCEYNYQRIVDAQIGNYDIEHKELEEKDHMKAMMIEEFIERSPKWNGGTTYRGIVLNPYMYKEFMKSAKEGASIEVSKGSLSSWSTNVDSAKKFSKGLWATDKRVVFVCNSRQYGTSVRSWSHINEAEVLCSSRCRYKVDKIRHGRGEDKGITFIEVTPTTNGNVNTGRTYDWETAKEKIKNYLK